MTFLITLHGRDIPPMQMVSIHPYITLLILTSVMEFIMDINLIIVIVLGPILALYALVRVYSKTIMRVRTPSVVLATKDSRYVVCNLGLLPCTKAPFEMPQGPHVDHATWYPGENDTVVITVATLYKGETAIVVIRAPLRASSFVTQMTEALVYSLRNITALRAEYVISKYHEYMLEAERDLNQKAWAERMQ